MNAVEQISADDVWLGAQPETEDEDEVQKGGR